MRVVGFVLAVVLVVIPSWASAATRTWTGGGVDINWSNPNNWNPAIEPVDGDDLVFPDLGFGSASTNDIPNLLVRSLTIASIYSLYNGASIRLQQGITLTPTASGSNMPFVRLPIQLAGSQTWTLPSRTALFLEAPGAVDLNGFTLTFAIASHLPPWSTVVVLDGPITGAGGLIKEGDGSLRMRVANSYTGSTIINHGGVDADSLSAFGVGDGTAANGTTIAAGAGVTLSDGVLPPEAFTISGSVSAEGNDVVVTGPVILAGQPEFFAAAGKRLTFNGVVSGGGALKVNQGTFVLANTNTYTGGTIITDFATLPSTELIVAATNALPPATTLNLPGSAQLTIRQHQQTIARLDGQGTVKFESTANPTERAALVLAPGAGIGVFTGKMTGDGILRHAGPGTHSFVVTGTDLLGTAAIDQGIVNLTGTLPMDVAIADGGELSLGDATVGPLTVSGRLSLASLGVASPSLTLTNGELRSVGIGSGPTTPGRITVSGPVSLGDSALSINLSSCFVNPIGTVFTVVNKTTPGPVNGTFAGLLEGASFIAGGCMLRISYGGGDGNDVTLTVLRNTRQYLLSEGATGTFFTTEIAIANPSATAGNFVRVDFFPVGGASISKEITMAPFGRTTIPVNNIPELAQAEFSTEVHSITGWPLIVERTMSWDESGYGAHTEHAVESLSTTWYFAEGSQGFFKTFLLLANPQDIPNVATVQYLRADEPPIERTYPLQPRSRFTVDVGLDNELVNRSFGMVVTFQHEGMAERAMYFGTTPFLAGGHESAGATAPSTTWFVPEGATGTFFETFILLANPSLSRLDVQLDFLPQGGTPVPTVITLEPKSRTTVNIETVHPTLANAAVATQVISPEPIIVERAQYWPDPAPSWYEAHNSFGVPQLGTIWGLAEGRIGQARNYQTFILLANPGDQDATVVIRFLREEGKPAVTRTFTVPPRSRFNVPTGPGTDVPELEDESFGALITSTQPIAVERAMYSNAPGQPVWAAGTGATAVRLQ